MPAVLYCQKEISLRFALILGRLLFAEHKNLIRTCLKAGREVSNFQNQDMSLFVDSI